jgi:hypothetical protein
MQFLLEKFLLVYSYFKALHTVAIKGQALWIEVSLREGS